ncbi:peptidase M28 [Macrococcoides canis]|uniref:M42 family metallopeptidase n=1 Tax=Macrococcoides canis TaxID=1855823 RepID=UPI0013E97DA6|nr:M42 family metallopeptidase [Macrococcus canis]QIH76269.1 peptidase M28 [Macrococcus canis]
MDKQLQLLKEMTDVNAPAGFEQPMTQFMKRLFENEGIKTIQDNTGSIFGVKEAASNHSIMLLGHLDEIGFMVTEITEKGFIKFTNLGSWSGTVMTSQKVTILTRKGEVRGVIGSKPPHVLPADERNKVNPDAMFIDIGTANREETLNAGVSIGDAITPYSEFEVMANPNYLLAKAFDNRFGCAAAYEVMKDIKHNITLYSGSVTQEETLSRGAITAANLLKPSLAIAIDVCICSNTPGMEQSGQAKMGEGPVILLSDAWNIGHVSFRRYVEQIAQENGIKVQHDHLTGGYTDAGHVAVSNNGVPAITISVPTRYIHSNVSMMHREDYNGAVMLLKKVVESLDDAAVERIIKQEI